MEVKVCSVHGCHGDLCAKGLCKIHYDKFRRNGTFKTAKQCTVEGCNGNYYIKGYCTKHYQQIIRRGKIIPDRKINIGCTVEGCTGKYYANGLCGKHYQQFRKLGGILDSEGGIIEMEVCTAKGCSKLARRKGLCNTHYKELVMKEREENKKERLFKRGVCSIEGCDKPVKAKGLCAGHYDKQWKASVNGRLPDDIRCEMPGCNNKKADKSEICSHCIKKLNRENDKYYRANIDLHITEEDKKLIDEKLIKYIEPSKFQNASWINHTIIGVHCSKYCKSISILSKTIDKIIENGLMYNDRILISSDSYGNTELVKQYARIRGYDFKIDDENTDKYSKACLIIDSSRLDENTNKLVNEIKEKEIVGYLIDLDKIKEAS